MRIVIALGGNALLRRSDPMTTEVQRKNIEIAARSIAPLAGGKTGKRAAIGSLDDIAAIVAGEADTNVVA